MAEIKKISYTHDALIDAIIACPAASQRELAALFGYTEAWISQIIHSDSFQLRLEERRKDTVDPILLQKTEERLEGLMGQAMEVLSEKLQASRNPDLAARVLDISARARGYGARERGVQVNASFVVALPQKAASGQDWQAQHAPQVQRIDGPLLTTRIDVDTVIDVPSTV
jgi:hypothetical protein